MLTAPLLPGAELQPVEPWQAEEFAAHLDRAREHIRPWVHASFLTDSVTGARETLQRFASTSADDGPRLFGIRLNGRLVGGTTFVSFSASTGVCEIGCWLEPSAEGKGLMTTACGKLLDWALVVRGLHRAEWRTRSDNVRSSALAQRLGMSLDGTLRESGRHEGRYFDEQLWSVLRTEHLARTR